MIKRSLPVYVLHNLSPQIDVLMTSDNSINKTKCLIRYL